MTVKRLSSEQTQFVNNSVEAAIRIGLLFAITVWCYDILRPFIMLIMWGVITAVATYPIFLWLRAKLGGRNTLAAVLLTVCTLLLLLIPTLMLSTSLVGGVDHLVEKLSSGQITIPPPGENIAGWPVVGEKIYNIWLMASEDIVETLATFQPQLTAFSEGLANKLTGLGKSILQFLGAIIVAGVLQAQAKSAVTLIENISRRLGGDAGLVYCRLSGKLIGSVTLGILGVAIIQAVLAGLGFVIAGVPAAGLWALLVLIMGVVQIGPMILIIPIGLYMFGELGALWGTVFLVWSIAVGLLDNFLKPVLLARGLDAPMIVVFLGAIGGFIATGLIGLFVGAIVLVVAWAILQAWIHGDSEELAEELLEE